MAELKQAFNELVLNRRSVKRYNPDVKISKEELTQILNDAMRAPSAINLQPWRFLIIDSEEGKQKLAALAEGNTDQVNTSSAVIAVFADRQWKDLTKEIYDQTVEEGNMPREIADHITNVVGHYMGTLDDHSRDLVITLDTGLFCQQLMITARAYGYDTCPIAGFDKANIAEAFGWDKERYLPLLLISIGKVGDEGKPSSRLPLERISEWK